MIQTLSGSCSTSKPQLRKPEALPNDEAEQDRLDLQHHIWMLLDGEVAALPDGRPLKGFDIGCGTGIWPWRWKIHFLTPFEASRNYGIAAGNSM
jgi:hypothetical protein